MHNRTTDILFQLVRSLEKAEKRNFKLYIKRSSNKEDLKVVQLFDALDKLHDYDEKTLLKKLPTIEKPQLANLKAHLYKQLLFSLRLINDETDIDIQLNEQMDYAKILYNKGLYLQSLKILDRVKYLAKANNQFTYLQQALFFEKSIESLYITRSMQNRAEELSKETIEISNSLTLTSQLSNLSLQLYSWYIQNGHSRNEIENAEVQHFFLDNLGDKTFACKHFYEKLYLYQSY